MFPRPCARLCVWDVLISDEEAEAGGAQGTHPGWHWVLLRRSPAPRFPDQLCQLPRPGPGHQHAINARRFAGQLGLCVDLFSLIRPVPVLFDMKIVGDTTQLIYNFENESNIISRL